MRYALLVEYEGTDFHGSQLQKGVRTVQGEIEAALEKIYGGGQRIYLAGRTDAGVHASGQVAAVDVPDRHDPETLRDALNFHLTDDVSIRNIEKTDDSFDPRRDAVRRHYVFALADGPARRALNRRFQVRTDHLEELDEMKRATEVLEGTHDFASFAGPATPAEASTVRRIDAVVVERMSGDTCRVRVSGNAFVHQQVRRMTGALVRIGTGKLRIEELRELVERPQRGAAGWPLGPEGLRLAGIEYGSQGPFASETEYN